MSFPGNQPASNSNTMQAGPRSYQSSPVAPTGPSTSSSSNTRNSKLEHIIQNFYTKTAQIIVQARLDPERHDNTNRRSSSSSSSFTIAGSSNSRSNKPNKWFNIATQDVDFLREELKYWRALSIQSVNEEPPPLMLDIVLDVSQLTHGQILVLADDRSRLNKIDTNGVDTILLERWVLSLNHPLPDFPVDLPNLYKRSIVFFRALYSFVRLLPSYSLHRRLRNYGQSNGLNINYRLTSSPTYRSDEIPLAQSILSGNGGIDEYDFSDVVTPLGTFKLHVEYRKNCDFQAEDSERDLSARMIDMDEHFFTPTMVQHRQEQRPRSVHSYEEESAGSRYAHRNSPPIAFRRESTDSSDPREIIQQRQRQSSMGLRGSPTSVSPLNRESSISTTRTSPGEASTTIGIPSSSTKRRTSAPHMSPFKSLPLSSSPQTEQILSSGVRSQTSQSEKSRASGVENSSPNSRNKIEFSPSFDKIRSSPSRTETSMMARRWSRTSDHSSINFVSTDDPELEEFIRFAAAKPDLKLAQNRASNSSQMIESANFSPSSETSSSLGASGYGSGSIYRSKKALSHYRNLRETHNTLSESLSSSVLASGERQESPAVYTSLGSSSTSSNSRPYLPAVRSPLHSEGSWNTTNNQSTSPMYIPRSYHQHSNSIDNDNRNHATVDHDTTSDTRRAAITAAGQSIVTATSSTVRQHRRYHSSQNVEHNKEYTTSREHDDIRSNNHPATAFSSYPQDRHHDELRRLCVLESNSPSSMLRRQESLSSIQDDSHTGLQCSSGSAIHNQGGRPSSLDDDDSLVFKMSELGGETHHSVEGTTTTTNENIVLHAHTSTHDYARRLGINSISSSSNNNSNGNKNNTNTIAPRTTALTAPATPVVTDLNNNDVSNTIVRRISSSTSIPQNTVAMATVMEEEEKNGSGSNSSIGKNDSHAEYPQRGFW
ncbi:autophagy-related protein 13-domain-containing protein [Circinella umbellata]|nr:autophagy-related protein 13-domain-containing protein [Circinella umbellata]